MNELELAPAKLTWFLEVTGVRPDGYHLLRSEMVSLDLHDVLRFRDGLGVTYSGNVEGVASLGVDGRDLVARALAVVGRSCAVDVEKHIPLGGGLGGGSADAAAVLRWASMLDPYTAVQLGGDVPFCLQNGRALVEGVGELVTPLPFEARTVTLFLPPFGVNTAACYAAYDELVRSGVTPSGRNHLTAPAQLVEPRLVTLMQWITDVYGEAILAGSGSTVFVEGDVTNGVGRQVVTSPVGQVEVVVATTTPAVSKK